MSCIYTYMSVWASGHVLQFAVSLVRDKGWMSSDVTQGGSRELLVEAD